MYTIYMTTECNFQCTYCYEDYKQQCTLTFDTLKKIIDFIFQREKGKRVRIGFLGGEPLLKKELIYQGIEYIEAVYPEKETAYYITTNCSLIDQDFIEMMSKREFHVRVSLDGNEETHKLNRIEKSGKNSYPTIMQNVLTLKDRVTECSIRMTAADNTLAFISENVKYFHRLGFFSIAVVPDLNMEFTPEQQALFQEQMNKVAEYYLTSVRLGNRFSVDLIEGKFMTMISESGSGFAMCGAGINSFNIMPDGNVYPCSFVTNDKKFCIGDVWNGIDEKKSFQLAKNLFDSSDRQCVDCIEQRNCHGMKCGYLNYVQTKKINVPSQCTCQQEKIMYPILERVLEEISVMDPEKIAFMKIYIDLVREDELPLTPIGEKILRRLEERE